MKSPTLPISTAILTFGNPRLRGSTTRVTPTSSMIAFAQATTISYAAILRGQRLRTYELSVEAPMPALWVDNGAGRAHMIFVAPPLRD